MLTIRGVWGGGAPLPYGGEVWGGGCALPINFFGIFIPKWRISVHSAAVILGSENA